MYVIQISHDVLCTLSYRFPGQVDSPQRTAPQSSSRLTSSHHGTLLQQLSKHASEWKLIGAALSFTPQELTCIESRPLLLATSPHSWLSEMLTQWLQWAPGDRRGSKDFATLEGLKDALFKANLGATAYDLKL